MAEENTNQKSPQALREEAVLAFWAENQIFEKSLQKKSPKGEFVFYDGPPTANGKPGIHHLEPRAFKDAIPRYKTMQGFHVRRKGGWDTHGLPVELQVEKQLGLTSKKQIEEYGIEKFNSECKKSVWAYIDEWEKFTDRIGYWIDHKNPYITYEAKYIESLWNVVKESDKKGLLYKDYRIVPWCARCGTGLSSHELAQGYKDVKDLSVYAKFKIIGFDNAYFIAWTTTPWTLPGNVALAVGGDIDYVEVKIGNDIFVVAKERVENLFEAGTYEIIAEHKGAEMLGMQYEPLYPYLNNIINANKNSNSEADKMEKAYKVYVADFVTTTDGTGIVHTAVMYGADDFLLGTQIGLPKFHLVNDDGSFKNDMDFLSGRFVRDEDVAIDIIKDLAHRGLLFKKEKYEHSYPHCWRCQTPLIYYARDSWYVRMSQIRDTLIANNELINWEPDNVKQGRFGEWIKDVKDWAISRERYWGTPLPIWLANDGDKIVVDSFDTLKKFTKKSGNKYFMVRHGEAEHNVLNICSSNPNNPHHLTEKGKGHVLKNAEKLKNENIDIIIRSPYVRAKETTQIIVDTIGFDKNNVIEDERVQEYKFGTFNLKSFDDYMEFRKGREFDMDFAVPEGESLQDAKNRFGEFLYEIDQKYQNKNIVIVTHGIAFQVIPAILECSNANDSAIAIRSTFHKVPDGHMESFELVKLPHNTNYELDPHRPFIDEVVLERDGKNFHRTKEVMDCWFDSGAMPFAQDHYMFKKQNLFVKLLNIFKKDKMFFPADFIAEGMDQTRGWFYTLHAVAAIMGKGPAYKNVICLGLILDKDGQKMSKSKGNIVDPWYLCDKYGADTLRLWMYSVNQPGDSKNFDEKTVKETEGKILTLLYNVLSFYDLYRDKNLETNNVPNSNNVLDQWILAKLNELVASMTNNLDGYKLLEPVREMREFIGDLSTWYLRRSRDRLKDGDTDAKKTLYYVLKTVAKIMAPFAPFAAEDIWQKLKTNDDVASVHLTEWPKAESVDEKILSEMVMVREICTEGNALRKKLNIAVKQPLASFTVAGELSNTYFEIIKDELNVKEILIGTEFAYDTEITPELKREGNYRELVRALQDLRKETGLTPDDVIKLKISENAQNLITGFENDLKKTVQIIAIEFISEFTDGETDVAIDGQTYKISIQK
jgi:isoleucyl-tRNA synthetase